MRNKSLFRDRYGELRLWAFMTLFIVGGIILVVVVLLPFLPLISIANTIECDTQWVDFTHRWDFFGGCLVEYDGTWYPADVLRSIIK